MKKIICFLLLVTILLSCDNSGQEKKDPLQKKSGTAETDGFENASNVKSKKAIEPDKFDIESLVIKLTPFIPEYSTFSTIEIGLLKSRLNGAIAKFGYGGEGSNPRFIVGPAVIILSQEIISTAPTLYAFTYDINFLMADVITQTVFSSYTIEINGVGETASKAFISGFRKFDFNTIDFYNFLKIGESKIIDYYNSNCDRFITEAKALYNERNYDEAYVILKNIPFEADNCFNASRELRNEIFNKKLSVNCNELLMKMQSELGKFNDPSASGFNNQAMSYYMLIDAESSCYNEAQKIYRNYIAKLDPKGKREWTAKMTEMKNQIKMAETATSRQYKIDSLNIIYNYMSKKVEFESLADIEGNTKLIEKYKYDLDYERQPWLQKVFNLGGNNSFAAYENIATKIIK